MSDSVPWFPEDWQSTEEQSTQEGVEEKQKPPVKKIRIKKSIPWVPEPPPPRAYKRQTHFTKEELEEKKKKAIAEEAERKAKKREENREKEEARWIELGRAICEISPEDVGLNDQNEEEFDPEWTGEEVVSSVHTFMNNLKKLIGPEQAKGTVLANCLTLTAAVCSVNQKSVVYIDQRIERIRKLKEEAAMKEIAEKQRLEEHWTEIGRAFCALSPEDVGIHRRHRKTPPADSEFSEVNGEDVVSNVFHFSMALKQLMGTHSKDTCFRSPFEVTSVIANVAEKTVRDRHPLHTLKAPADF